MNLLMLKILTAMVLLGLPTLSFAQAPDPSIDATPTATDASSNQAPIDHSVFSEILKRFASKKGVFDYRTFKREKDYQVQLNDYLEDMMKIDGAALENNSDR